MKSDEVYLVVGHFTPTDDTIDPQHEGKLDYNVTAKLCFSKEQVSHALLWFPDGIVISTSWKLLDRP